MPFLYLVSIDGAHVVSEIVITGWGFLITGCRRGCLSVCAVIDGALLQGALIFLGDTRGRILGGAQVLHQRFWGYITNPQVNDNKICGRFDK